MSSAVQKCIDSFHLREVLTYQPRVATGPFQLYETAIFIALALALVGFSFWWVRHRIS